MLDFPAPRLLCYSRESAIAEKFEAMVKLGALNNLLSTLNRSIGWLFTKDFSKIMSPNLLKL